MRFACRLLPALPLAAALAPLAGCSGAEEAPAGPLAWGACGAYECAALSVPVDHDDPGGPTFTIPVLRRRALDPAQRIGSLVVNPGGPGGSGTGWVGRAWPFLPPDLQLRFDVVGFDPRGIPPGSPVLDCVDDLDEFVALDLTPDDPAELQSIIDGGAALAEACAARSGDILPFIGTDSVARDMDLLRAALGDERLTYLGFSYGTMLGAVYADLFPDRVRALVLDGALDPSLTGEAHAAAQGEGFEDQLEAFLAECAADPACDFHSADPGAAYDAIQASIEAAPMPTSEGARVVGPGALAYGVANALYSPISWPRLAEALALAGAGDGAGILRLADDYLHRDSDGTYDDSLELYYAVTSLDAPFSQDPADYEALVAELSASAPRLGVYLPFSSFPSARWPVPPWRPAEPIHARGAPPILVVATTHDPATPYAEGVALAEQLDSGVLLTREGDGHVGFLRGNGCIDAAIVDYLVNRAAPEDGAACPDPGAP
ncbi:MAG: alpha/beta fold hydrolase [Polyangiaceae bacterium]|nr:alpha/beta fold hydrolase [Polyangiaceae bacterium]